MAACNGFKSHIKIGSTYIRLMDGWSLSVQQNNPEYVSFGSTFKSCFSAVKSWTASAKGTLDRSATGQVALIGQLESGGTVADIALRFYPSTASGRWQGNARIENFSIDSAVDDKINVSFAFKGNGSIAWSTT